MSKVSLLPVTINFLLSADNLQPWLPFETVYLLAVDGPRQMRELRPKVMHLYHCDLQNTSHGPKIIWQEQLLPCLVFPYEVLLNSTTSLRVLSVIE